jgi:ankyrin repeat protein
MLIKEDIEDGFGLINFRTPLHEAASTGKIEVVQYLRLRGADVLIVNDAGQTAEMVAIDAGYNPEIVDRMFGKNLLISAASLDEDQFKKKEMDIRAYEIAESNYVSYSPKLRSEKGKFSLFSKERSANQSRDSISSSRSGKRSFFSSKSNK